VTKHSHVGKKQNLHFGVYIDFFAVLDIKYFCEEDFEMDNYAFYG